VKPGVYTIALNVVIDRDGKILRYEILRSSGVREFDLAVRTA
jgi:TonB family protein